MLGAGQAWLAPRLPGSRLVIAELAGWSVGNAAVIAGTVLTLPILVDAGGALLALTLTVFAQRVRRVRHVGWPLWAYRAVLGGLLVSVAIGLVLTNNQA